MKHPQARAFTYAVALHLGFLLFGGLLFFHAPKKDEKIVINDVGLVHQDKPKDKDQKKEEVKEELQKAEEQLQQAAEQLPDARDVAKIDSTAAPALEALSLSELESALNSDAAGSAAFAQAVRFASGGVIGGVGVAGAGEKLDAVFSIGDLDQKPRPVFQMAPLYPADLRKQGIHGTVYVVFIVDKEGKVSNPKVEKTPHPGFERPALDAVKQWKFEPGVKGGQHVAFKMRVPLTFSNG